MTERISDYIGVLAHSSLSVAKRKSDDKPDVFEFYAQVCFPPEVGQMLWNLAASIAPNGDMNGVQVAVYRNDSPMAGSQPRKPIPGIPGDWLVVKGASQYAPYVADAQGNQLVQGNPEVNARINTTFYAGKRVRVELSPWMWGPNKFGQRGVSFNLFGVMDAGEEGERLNIGSGMTANAFAKHAQPGGQQAAGQQAQQAGNHQASPFAAPAPAPAPAANPFANPTVAAPAASVNPFAQPQRATNPFAR